MLHSRAIGIIINTSCITEIGHIGLSKAVHVQFKIRKLVFTIIPISRECSIINSQVWTHITVTLSRCGHRRINRGEYNHGGSLGWLI